MKKLSFTLFLAILIMLSLTMIVSASDYSSSTDYTPFIAICIAGPFIGVIIFIVAVVASYKKKLRGAIYPLDKFTTLDLTSHSDTYSHSHTTRYRYRNSSKK